MSGYNEIFVPYGIHDDEVHQKFPDAHEVSTGLEHGKAGRYFRINGDCAGDANGTHSHRSYTFPEDIDPDDFDSQYINPDDIEYVYDLEPHELELFDPEDPDHAKIIKLFHRLRGHEIM